MKIICIGRNYVAHAKELNNDVPTQPIVFLKPSTALKMHADTFHYPSFSQDIHYEVELVLEMNNRYKDINKEKAISSINRIGLGIDFTARDLQNELKKSGHPWEIAKGFDESACCSPLFPVPENLSAVEFSLSKNGKVVQRGNSAWMIFDPYTIITYVSKFFTLEKGDLIFTGTPSGVGSVTEGDILSGQLMGKNVFNVKIV